MSVRSAGLAALTVGIIIVAPGVANAQKAAASPVQQALRDRCFAAITAHDPAVKTSALKETIGMEAGGGHYLFELKPAGGDTRDLPAELDRKCAYYLQKEVTRSPAVNRAVVQRIRITPDHTDRNWLYMMTLDEKEFRCVVRKSDGNFRVEAKTGETWRPIATGILF